MPTPHYDEKELLRQLQPLPNRLRTAFAAACAQRQVENYAPYSKVAHKGNSQILVRALSCLWAGLESRRAAVGELRERLDACMSLLPEEDDYFDGLAYYAEDAVSSAVYAIETLLKSDIQSAIWAARHANDALHEFVSAQKPDARFDRKEEERIRSHPLVKAEWIRQQVDLRQLHEIATGTIGEAEGLAALRRRAQSDASKFLGR
ncbi:MAG TPA: DUF416 family protein [Xanthobacteraceae bacterium]|jgi:uncharacterized protein YjaG (DUF416 family)|nr:DUF416 family protein [Xanthobacteraceae bacterium]